MSQNEAAFDHVDGYINKIYRKKIQEDDNCLTFALRTYEYAFHLCNGACTHILVLFHHRMATWSSSHKRKAESGVHLIISTRGY